MQLGISSPGRARRAELTFRTGRALWTALALRTGRTLRLAKLQSGLVLAGLLLPGALLGGSLLSGCSRVSDEPRVVPASAPVPVPEANGPRDVAVLEIEGRGEIRIELLHELAPATVDNFVELAEQGFYDETTFHRVLPGFAIQGGDPKSRNRDPRDDGLGGPGYTIPDEFSEVAHRRGIVSMANSGYPASAGSQFFVVVEDARSLDGKYAVFGQVVEGMELVESISQVARDEYGRHGPRDRPLRDVVIQKVRLERNAGGSVIADAPNGESGKGIEYAPSPGAARPASAAPASSALPASPDPGAR